MNVFIIPAWHPTPEKPNWCNWIKPHIEMAKAVCSNVTVLQVDLESNTNNEDILKLNENHYYISAGNKKNKFHRTKLFYGKILNNYIVKLEKLFLNAIEINGKPDLIHAHVSMPAGYGAAFIGKKYDIPVIVTEHYSGFFSDIKYPWRIGKFYKKMRTMIDGFYVVSPGYAKRIKNKSKIEVDGVLTNPVNTQLFKMDNSHEKGDVLHLVSTGTIGKIKGTDLFLKALKLLPDTLNWKLTLIGKQPSKNLTYWQVLIKSIPEKKIKLISFLTQEELKTVYSNSDIYIVSSRIETANVSMLEAMACGCYVITSRIDAPETLVTNEVSETFNNTPEGLAQAIINVSQKKMPDRETLRNFVIENYSYKALEQKLINVYEKHCRK